MRVAVVSGLIHERYGGPPAVVRTHLAALRNRVDASLFAVAPERDIAVLEASLPGSSVFPQTWPGRWFRGKRLSASLRDQIRSFDVVHAHMLWDHAVWTAARAAREAGVPLIVTPHGSLSEAWRYRKLHKRLYWRLVLRDILASAAFESEP